MLLTSASRRTRGGARERCSGTATGIDPCESLDLPASRNRSGSGLACHSRLLDDLHDLACIRIHENCMISDDSILVFDVGDVDLVKLDRVRERGADVEFDTKQAD